MNDPRRFGHVSLDPDLSGLGIDIFAVTASALAPCSPVAGRSVKAALLDQHVVAGLGNLCVDEVLWWAGIDPRRAGDGLTVEPKSRVLASAIRRRLPIMLRRGGSTTGVIDPRVRRCARPVSTRRRQLAASCVRSASGPPCGVRRISVEPG